MAIYQPTTERSGTSAKHPGRRKFTVGNTPATRGRFSKASEYFWAREAIAKSRTLRLQSRFIHIFST